MVAWPAVADPMKVAKPLVISVLLPAVAESEKIGPILSIIVWPALEVRLNAIILLAVPTSVCTALESFTTPAPTKVKSFPTLIVKARALAVKTMLSIVAAPESKTFVTLETSNVATSVRSIGTLCGVQFAAVFQSLLVGSAFHVALPAKTSWLATMDTVATTMLNLRFIEYLRLSFRF
jgi:hypothetical protein